MVYTPKFYSAADQKIYNDGTYFRPQERFTLPYNQVPTDDENSVEPDGILSANIVNNNGNQFSVYNPDPNTISNSNYNEDPYKSYLYRDRFPMMGDPVANQATGALNADGIMSYAGDKPQSKFLEMLSQGINLIPGANMAKKGLEYLGDMLPTNRRAIFENELAGQGVRVNDIGQIVQGGGAYDDASGRNVMAGYNANKMTADTYKKRRDMINETIDRKLKADPTYDRSYLDNRLTALDASQESILGTATDRANIIYADEEEEKNKNKKNTIVNRYITKKKETKAAEDAKAVEDAKAAQGVVDVEAVKAAIEKTKSEGFGTTSEGNYINQFSGGDPGNTTTSSAPSYTAADTNRESQRGQQTSAPTRSAPSRQSRHTSDPGGLHSYNKGGRIGYFFGGLAARRMKR